MGDAPETVTQFCARALGLPPHEPPASRRGARYGASAPCWLCGGATGGVGWPQALAVAPTFTSHNAARRPDSDAVCQACAAFTRAETFQALVASRGLPLKTWTQCGWHSYSHHVRGDGHYEAPVPSRARDILLAPPPGRWVLALNTTGQKHTLFRGAVADSAARAVPVQLDETTVWADRAAFAACLGDFERLTALGCGSDSVHTGRYHPEDIARAGLARWRPAEARMERWRASDPSLLALVRAVARSAKATRDLGLAEPPAERPVPRPTPSPAAPPVPPPSPQGRLF